ncbi:mannose-6-phosphate isomerase, class I [Lipingzhangella sp. LS1_29]|uniref:mannose-6-phosphate isomerase n=1 Tax=Lipingzhangella rawalii TaxID=2055835 RepID=A0ABU2H7C1_9ACTN|nr:mannose-6-phosphate isomerase, class I [Lipingzhangella rawalii]MDS1271195.1 mannose-6-phosphate isomerase, class I [Lipingzhangella rawalii]
MHRMTNQVRPYAWGSRTEIPRLLGVSPTGEPQAELWLGAHPAAPSMLHHPHGTTPLDSAISADPTGLLGSRTTHRFGPRLPYLLKMLAAASPLSLQAHPDADQARAGYAHEESAGIPLDAPERNYPDPFSKPELLVALEPFVALCGFRQPQSISQELGQIDDPVIRRLRVDLTAPEPAAALRAAFTRLLRLGPSERDQLLTALLHHRHGGQRDTPGVLGHGDTVLELAKHHPDDPGVAASILLNRIELQPGEALFLPPGNVHAYLRGTAIEVMGSSDNVLRAGLTSKHVNVNELLRTVRFTPLPVPYVRPERSGRVMRYVAPTQEFVLSMIEPGADPVTVPGGLPRVLLCLTDQAHLHTREQYLALSRGESAFLPAADETATITGAGRLVLVAPGT